jgi:hypothetical protein
MATVQAPGGDVIVARSGDDGASWTDRLLKAPKGSNFSAADVVLLPDRKAMITYVNERVRRAKLLATKVVSRWSPDDGTSLRKPRTVAGEAKRLRMAPNIATDGHGVSIVLAVGTALGLASQRLHLPPALASRAPPWAERSSRRAAAPSRPECPCAEFRGATLAAPPPQPLPHRSDRGLTANPQDRTMAEHWSPMRPTPRSESPPAEIHGFHARFPATSGVATAPAGPLGRLGVVPGSADVFNDRVSVATFTRSRACSGRSSTGWPGVAITIGRAIGESGRPPLVGQSGRRLVLALRRPPSPTWRPVGTPRWMSMPASWWRSGSRST